MTIGTGPVVIVSASESISRQRAGAISLLQMVKVNRESNNAPVSRDWGHYCSRC